MLGGGMTEALLHGVSAISPRTYSGFSTDLLVRLDLEMRRRLDDSPVHGRVYVGTYLSYLDELLYECDT